MTLSKNSVVTVGVTFDDLLEYTDWERDTWFERLRQGPPELLRLSMGPHGDGRFSSIGDVVRHIFSAETRYVERMLGRPLTDTATIPTDNVDALLAFATQSRRELREFINRLPTNSWDVPMQLTIMGNSTRATPRKIVTHVLLHEIRHWAQIKTVLRFNSITLDFHDFLLSPAMDREPGGGEGSGAIPQGGR